MTTTEEQEIEQLQERIYELADRVFMVGLRMGSPPPEDYLRCGILAQHIHPTQAHTAQSAYEAATEALTEDLSLGLPPEPVVVELHRHLYLYLDLTGQLPEHQAMAQLHERWVESHRGWQIPPEVAHA